MCVHVYLYNPYLLPIASKKTVEATKLKRKVVVSTTEVKKELKSPTPNYIGKILLHRKKRELESNPSTSSAKRQKRLGHQKKLFGVFMEGNATSKQQPFSSSPTATRDISTPHQIRVNAMSTLLIVFTYFITFVLIYYLWFLTTLVLP